MNVLDCASAILSSTVFGWAFNAAVDAECQAVPEIASDFVGLKDGQKDVEEPESAKESEGGLSAILCATELSSNLLSSTEQANNAKQCAEDKYDDTETQTACWHKVVA